MSVTPNVLKSQIKKEFGDVLIDSSCLEELEGKTIPTTLGLDIALNGGLAEGTVMNIGGKPKAGKTTLCLTILAQAQKMHKRCFYVDIEGRLRSDLMKCIDGLVWTEEQEKETGLPALTIIRSTEGNFLTAEKTMNIIITLFKECPGCVVVLDSLAMLCTEADFAAQIGGSSKMMGVPSLMYKFLRTIAQIIPTTQSNLITITHVQDSPNAYSGPVEVGGNAIQFQSSYRLTCLSSTRVPKESFPKIGQDSKFKISASALGPPGGEAIVYIRYGNGCDKEEDIVSVAEEMGFLSKAGAWYSFNIDNEDLPEKIQGRANVVQLLKENKELTDKLENQIRSMVFGET